ncbi:hypothetical protein XENORESO_020577 [Xenotaenia resolanae]|uniref:Uncharacterized protein n=1 Tax=Xenotaenia resolanae TaxID=208358 RepID=A0ABV0X3N8_9TELE
MWDHEIRAMASTHAIIAASVFMATVLPAVLVPGFSVYGTHLLWLYSVSAAVAAVSVSVFWLLGISPPTKKHTLGYKVAFTMTVRRAIGNCSKIWRQVKWKKMTSMSSSRMFSLFVFNLDNLQNLCVRKNILHILKKYIVSELQTYFNELNKHTGVHNCEIEGKKPFLQQKHLKSVVGICISPP